MAKTSYINIPVGSEELYFKGLNLNDRFTFSRVVRKDSLLSVKRKKGISQRSLLPQLSAVWATLTGGQKAAWLAAGKKMNINGWQLFVQDQTIRVLNGLGEPVTPSLIHQSWVGELKIASPATELKIAQLHPHTYYVLHKLPGKKAMYEPVQVNEDLAFPLKIGLSYKGELTSLGAGSFAKFYALVWRSYQGVDYQQELAINLDLSSAWQAAEVTLSAVVGTLIGYNLYFHLYNVEGSLYIDDIIAYHSAANWARDPYCKAIATTFTKAFYQIPKHWVALTLPDGAEYDTVYKDF